MPLADGIRFFMRLKLYDEGLMMEGRKIFMFENQPSKLRKD
jgi:hypothetical protein